MYRAKNKKIKFRQPRIKCPLCGFLAWPICFEKEHNLEVKMQYTKGGRAKRDFVSYHDVISTRLLEFVRRYLIGHCQIALARLRSQIITQTVATPSDEADRLEAVDAIIRSFEKVLESRRL